MRCSAPLLRYSCVFKVNAPAKDKEKAIQLENLKLFLIVRPKTRIESKYVYLNISKQSEHLMTKTYLYKNILGGAPLKFQQNDVLGYAN